MQKTMWRYASILLLACQVAHISAHRQPVIKNGKYYFSQEDNHKHIDLKRALLFLGKRIFSPKQWIKAISAPFYSSTEHKSDARRILQPTQMIPPEESIEPKLVWIGHASFLIQINGFNILTDPIWGHVKEGPLTIAKRGMPPGIKLEDLPAIDVIIISHNHSDHTDPNTLMALSKKYDPTIFVPVGDKALFQRMGFSHVVENTWWDSHTLTKNDRTATFSFLPAYHWSWSIRFSLWSYRKSLWGSWMISADDTNIYFAGDSAYADHFKEIGEQFPSIDVALIPIGPTSEGENRHKHC